MNTFEPIRTKARGSLTLRGETVNYETVCEDNVFMTRPASHWRASFPILTSAPA